MNILLLSNVYGVIIGRNWVIKLRVRLYGVTMWRGVYWHTDCAWEVLDMEQGIRSERLRNSYSNPGWYVRIANAEC